MQNADSEKLELCMGVTRFDDTSFGKPFSSLVPDKTRTLVEGSGLISPLDQTLENCTPWWFSTAVE